MTGMDRRASLSFDRIADRYDESRGGTARGERVAADLVPWLAPGRVLEVGVGTGIVAAALAARGLPVYGVDLSQAMLRRAVDRVGSRSSAPTRWPFPSRRARWTTCCSSPRCTRSVTWPVR